jgi:hypothetical protein
MNLISVLNSIRSTARNHGGLSAIYDIGKRSVNRYVYCKTLQCLITEKVKEECLALPSGFRFTRLEYPELLHLAKTPEYELSADFLEAVMAKGDDCYAIFDGPVLANYGWYSRKPTLMDNKDILVQFNPCYVYMYKGFTLDRYRGQRLHAISKTRALAEYLAKDCKGMLSYVESNNFNSLKSSYRMGAVDCGRFSVLRIAGKYVIRIGPECEEYGITLYRDVRGSSSIARALVIPDERSGCKSRLPLFSLNLRIE